MEEGSLCFIEFRACDLASNRAPFVKKKFHVLSLSRTPSVAEEAKEQIDFKMIKQTIQTHTHTLSKVGGGGGFHFNLFQTSFGTRVVSSKID
jgi:hypothetical protein